MSYLHDICLDEIALEGLDGITLACLWCRLDQRLPKFPLSLDAKAMQFLWGGVTTKRDVAFYRLPEPRDLPTFPHEYRTTDETTGIITLNEKIVRKECPGCIINCAENDGIRGSCSTFKERVDISDEVRGQDGGKALTLEEVQERWGDSLVIVATQELRLSTILGPHGDPSVELSDINYCLLEYIGRQRHHSANQLDFARMFKFTAASMHSYHKGLTRYELIDRRMCWCETTTQTKNFIMLTLPRFVPFAKHGCMSRFTILSNHVMKFLDEQPKKTAKYKVLFGEMVKKFPFGGSRKEFKASFKKVYLLLQTLKAVQVMHCRSGIEVDSFKLLKKLNEDKDVDEDARNNYDATSGLVAELPMGFQVYNLIDNMQHTPQGIDYRDIERIFQLEGRYVRCVVDKSLLNKKLIKFNLFDEGRQRVRKFHTVNATAESAPKKVVDGDGDAQACVSTPTESIEPHKQTSLRYMKRRKKILELIKKHKVQEGNFGMLKDLRVEEELEGSKVRCDPRSVQRIVVKLEKEGLCQTFSSVVMSDDGKMNRTVRFVMDANVSKDDPKILHIIQQVKFRMINFKLHHPWNTWTSTGKKTRQKITVAGKGRKPRPKRVQKKRVTQYQTLAQPSNKDTKVQRSHTTTHDALWGSNEKDDNAAGTDDGDNERSEQRQFAWKRGLYGCLQKMERIRVLHRFIWYVVYGMPKRRPPETPQPVVSISENEIPTIKQEFDENQQNDVTIKLDEYCQEIVAANEPQNSSHLIGQPADQPELPLQPAVQSERSSEADNGVLNLPGAMIGEQDQKAGMSEQAADQSGTPSQSAGGILNRPEVMIGRQDQTAGSIIGKELQDGLTIVENNIGQEVTEATDSQMAINLLESIQSGVLPDEQSSGSVPTPNLDVAVSTTDLKSEHYPSSSDNQNAEITPGTIHKVYLDVMDWRRFVQPLPEYKDIPEGWCFLGDLILSMPLVTFCEVNPFRYVVDGLENYLKDPVRRLLLIKDLPLLLRRKLLEGRRYLFSLEEGIERMCSMGLAIYTPHHHEGKETLSTYICRNVTIVDTTSSKPCAYYIFDKPYPSFKHHLVTLDDVEKFWFELKVICLDTPLGTSRHTIPDTGIKPNRSKITGYARTLKTYLDPVVDDGRIPGDGRGAGGYDSSFYSHLRRNWTSDSINPNCMSRQRFQNRFQGKIDKVKKTPGRLSNLLQRKTVSLSTTTGAKEDISVETKLVDVEEHKAETVGGKGLKRKKPRAPHKVSETKIARKKWREERKQAKEDKKLHKQQKRAVGIVTRIVFNWTPPEDSVLLLCKVASTIFNKVLSYNHLITWETIQRVFMKKLPHNVTNREKKDAKAISKRSTRLMRNSEYRMNYSVCLGEVYEDQVLMDSINPHLDKHSPEAIASEYEELVDKLEAKFRIEGGFNTHLPDDITTLHRDYSVVTIAKTDTTNKIFFKDENITDLRRLALHTIVLSNLSSQTALDYDARLAFKLYDQYDSNLLHDVLLYCRSKGLVSRSLKKKHSRRIVPHLPVCYQLSNSYTKHFKMKKMPHKLPEEVVTCYKTLLESAPQESVSYHQVTCGSCSCQILLLLSDQVNCKIIVPKQVIILDSNLIDKDFIEQSGLLKKDADSSYSDSDTEDESEDDDDDDEDEDDEDQGQRIEGQTEMDVKGTIEVDVRGIGVEEKTPGMVGVSFEEDGDENKMEAESVEIEPGPSSLGDAKEESAREDSNAMDTLSELASSMCSMNSQPSVSTHPQTPSVNPSVTDLDHSYFQSAPTLLDRNHRMLTGSGDGGYVGQKCSTSFRGTPSESGDAPRNIAQVSAQDGLSSETKQTHSESVDVIGDTNTISPSQAESSESRKIQPRNATMKCLNTSQSSFTKWLILQGHFAPGVCGKHISALQENIAFNAFKINLTQKPSVSSHDDRHQGFHPCSSLFEYLLRPCKGIESMEAVCKPTELSQETTYLEEVYKGTFIKRKGDSIQDFMERCTEQGLDISTTTSFIQVYKQIEEAGILGVTVPKVKRIVGRIPAQRGANILLDKCVSMLLQHQMIWEVGANELRLVATKHVSVWAIQSQRLVIPEQFADTAPSAKRHCLDTLSDVGASIASGENSRSRETIDLTKEPPASGIHGSSPTENVLQSDASPGSTSVCDTGQAAEVIAEDRMSEAKGQPEVIELSTDSDEVEDVIELGELMPGRKDSDSIVDEAMASGSTSTESGHGRAGKRKLPKVFECLYEPVEFVPYPWRKVNGEVNRPELFLMMRGIALLIMAEPGIKESQLLHHFKELFRRVDTLKLLQMMSDIGLITRHRVRLPKPSLFSSAKSRNQPQVYYYQPSVNCLTKMGTLFVHQE